MSNDARAGSGGGGASTRDEGRRGVGRCVCVCACVMEGAARAGGEGACARAHTGESARVERQNEDRVFFGVDRKKRLGKNDSEKTTRKKRREKNDAKKTTLTLCLMRRPHDFHILNKRAADVLPAAS